MEKNKKGLKGANGEERLNLTAVRPRLRYSPPSADQPDSTRKTGKALVSVIFSALSLRLKLRLLAFPTLICSYSYFATLLNSMYLVTNRLLYTASHAKRIPYWPNRNTYYLGSLHDIILPVATRRAWRMASCILGTERAM